MARGRWKNAKSYNFGGLGGSRVTNMNPWNCDTRMRKLQKLQSFVNVTDIIKEELVCMPVEEPLPTESSKTKCIPFALNPEFQKPCRYGLGCTRMGCLYQHPTDMPLAEPGKLVDVDVYVSMIERHTTKSFIEEIGRKHGKVLYIAMPKKDPAGNYISKRPDGRFTCNIHFSHAESATSFIKFINNETKIPVLAEMKAVWQNIDEYDHSVDSSHKVDWRESLKNKAARLKPTAAPQPVRLTRPVQSPPVQSPPVQPTPVQPTPVQSTPVQSTPVQSTRTPTPTPPPDEPEPLITTRVRKVEDAEGFTTIGRNGKAIYELEIEQEDDELCLEENNEETIQEKRKQERSTCGTSSTESSPNTFSITASPPSSPFTVPSQKLVSWHDLQEKKKNETKEAFGARSFLSLFKAVDASDNESEAQASEAKTSEHPPLAQVTVHTEDNDANDDDDDESIASIDSAALSEIDDLEDDFVFAKNAARRR